MTWEEEATYQSTMLPSSSPYGPVVLRVPNPVIAARVAGLMPTSPTMEDVATLVMAVLARTAYLPAVPRLTVAVAAT